jgi:hypothetical protein
MFKLFSLVGIFDEYLMLDLLNTILHMLGLKVFLFIIVNVIDLGSVVVDYWDYFGHCEVDLKKD